MIETESSFEIGVGVGISIRVVISTDRYAYWCQVSLGRCQVASVKCQFSGVMARCQVSGVRSGVRSQVRYYSDINDTNSIIASERFRSTCNRIVRVQGVGRPCLLLCACGCLCISVHILACHMHFFTCPCMSR